MKLEIRDLCSQMIYFKQKKNYFLTQVVKAILRSKTLKNEKDAMDILNTLEHWKMNSQGLFYWTKSGG